MKKFFKKYKIFRLLSVVLLSILTFSCFCNGDDIMEKVFQPVKNNIIYIGNNPNDVGTTILREKTEGSVGLNGYTINTKDPLIVRVVQFILKMTVVLSVTMVIYYSVKFMIQIFKGNDLKSAGAKKDLINLIIGLLIALFSITITELAISIPKKSLQTSGDISYMYIQNQLS